MIATLVNIAGLCLILLIVWWFGLLKLSAMSKKPEK